MRTRVTLASFIAVVATTASACASEPTVSRESQAFRRAAASLSNPAQEGELWELFARFSNQWRTTAQKELPACEAKESPGSAVARLVFVQGPSEATLVVQACLRVGHSTLSYKGSWSPSATVLEKDDTWRAEIERRARSVMESPGSCPPNLSWSHVEMTYLSLARGDDEVEYVTAGVPPLFPEYIADEMLTHQNCKDLVALLRPLFEPVAAEIKKGSEESVQ